ncbi:MAG: hypothetical protein ABR543_01025 [Gemmatimonadaceae bacterium]
MKLAADRVVRGFARQRTLKWGEHSVTIPMTQFCVVPKVPRLGTEQASDAALLPLIAHLASCHRIELLWHLDSAIEFGGLPNTDSPRGRFFGVPITSVHSPQPWGRLIADGHKSMAEHQFDFLHSRQDPRFLELQVAVGLKQGSNKFRNQLLDAWHVWCAESAGATHFLTCDYKLIRHLELHMRTRPTVKVVTPRGLLADLRTTRHMTLWDLLSFGLQTLRSRIRSRPQTGLEELAAFGEILEREGHYDPPQNTAPISPSRDARR